MKWQNDIVAVLRLVVLLATALLAALGGEQVATAALERCPVAAPLLLGQSELKSCPSPHRLFPVPASPWAWAR